MPPPETPWVLADPRRTDRPIMDVFFWEYALPEARNRPSGFKVCVV